jgi:hypothetical protein
MESIGNTIFSKYHQVLENKPMWKNVFIESCILSALIFGGFYYNAVYLKKEISVTHQESQDKLLWTHISGFEMHVADPEEKMKLQAHFSGNSTELHPVAPISGADQPPLPGTQ